MITLTQSAGLKGSTGDPLPTVWGSLADQGTIFLRGQLVLVAAPPGTGKSAFVLSYALRSKVSCLYFSADSDPVVQLTRSIAILTGATMKEAADMVMNASAKQLGATVGECHTVFSYNPSPSLRHIQAQILGYEELYGCYPELIVVDNALDVAMESADIDQSQSLDALMGWLHEMARTTGACVIALHHVTGHYNDSRYPIPLSGVKGQVGRVPEMILTLHRGEYELDGATSLRISTVKNRGGKSDPTGNTFVETRFDGYRMSIEDWEEGTVEDPWEKTGL